MSNNIIDKDKQWLKERIERGIEGFIDCEKEYLTTLLMKYVYEDIFLSGCFINSRDEGISEAILQIHRRIVWMQIVSVDLLIGMYLGEILS
ncbi:MAG: hypothetical protein IKN41_02125 [Candidatus Methanomethylophilaceae archaeon]|nr:hypothetical protein [Candidatus Methanomethylophilaceae archaeon]